MNTETEVKKEVVKQAPAPKQVETNKDRLRRLTLGRDVKFQHKVIKYYPPIYKEIIDEETGEVIGERQEGHEKEPIKVLCIQPTVKERNDLVRTCRNPDGSFNEMEFIVQAAIRFVYDPETNERLYSAHDYDMLVNQPAGDFVDQFGGEAIELLTLGERTKDEENSKKIIPRTLSTA